MRSARHRFAQPQHRHRGFTMLEMVITMLVLGIMAAVTLPRFLQSLDHYRADAAARQLQADLQLAQRTARTTGSAESISFDVTGHRYSFSSLADPNRGANVYTVDLADAPYYCSLSTVAFADRPSITFDGYGFPNAAGKITVASGDEVRTLSLDGATGQILVVGDEP